MTKTPKKSTASVELVAVKPAGIEASISTTETSQTDKSAAKYNVAVRDAKTGRLVTVKGAGALRGRSFEIMKNIDLTKPIAKQVLRDNSRHSG